MRIGNPRNRRKRKKSKLRCSPLGSLPVCLQCLKCRRQRPNSSKIRSWASRRMCQLRSPITRSTTASWTRKKSKAKVAKSAWWFIALSAVCSLSPASWLSLWPSHGAELRTASRAKRTFSKSTIRNLVTRVPASIQSTTITWKHFPNSIAKKDKNLKIKMAKITSTFLGCVLMIKYPGRASTLTFSLVISNISIGTTSVKDKRPTIESRCRKFPFWAS